MYQVPLEVYAELRQATPGGKRDIVLSLIEERPDHRLELPDRGWVHADLRGVDLSRQALQELVEQRGGATPPWWLAVLRCAQLKEANLQGAILMQASLRGASLRVANLQDADLFGANLRDANLSEANLQGAHLDLADLQGAILIDANLQGAHLLGTNLRDANLSDANLQGADLSHAHLQDASLWRAHLQGANLWRANLEHAILQDAQLEGVDLSTSNIRHCYLGRAWLDGTRLRPEQLGGAVGEELGPHPDYAGAKLAYLGLKQNFDTLGDYAASSWAYRKERRMEKREALQKARYAKVLIDQMVELVCDYGEGFLRVLVCLAVLWFDFALVYGVTGHVLADRGLVYSTTRNLFDLLSFSLGTMVTIEVPGLCAYPSLLMRVLMPLEAALGISFLGLLGFVAGNRIRCS